MRPYRIAALIFATTLTLFATVASGAQTAQRPDLRPAAATVPVYDHVVVVIFENTNYSTIKGSTNAPYLNSLAAQGTLFTNSFGVTHPSQPNYLALFSGTQQGVTSDSCPKNFTTGNLGQQLLDKSKTFAAYSEDLPSAGYTGCSSGDYVRKHAPWADFPTVGGAAYHLPFSGFPSDYSKLPTVSFVVPDMCNDMHDCSTKTGDTWLKNNLDAYAQWAKTHNSLLIQTFDEDNFTSVNQIYTTFVGAHVKAGHQSSEQINHYGILRTLEDMYGLPALGNAASASPVADAWDTGTPPDPGTTVYADDFETDPGWMVNPSGTDTATAGRWERGDPQQTVSTASNLVTQLGTTPSGTQALTTGLAAGSSYGANDVDGGVTSVRSGVIALPAGSSSLTLNLKYSLAHGDNSGPDDYFRVKVVDGSTATTVLEKKGVASTSVAGSWQSASVNLAAYAGKSVRLLIETADAGTGSLLETQVDDVRITSN
ncbi:alkaline phosphatase family protein [Streptomyces sp. NBC_01304]|uniref:alkaline phosphatase family protein n=1 Tax=Streptomyces sp. NBC_01304 TaxID=2903818 RepID=UPI002E156214|nr:alkaline phosphatase family protein [Streptomyces sp. NBC_01304]